MKKRYAIISLALAAILPAVPSQAQMTNDPNTWPAAFDGTQAGGPFVWANGAPANLANAVQGGQEGQTRLYVCRATLRDGVHTGKYFNGICNIGWGGGEVVVKQGYQVLVNTRPELAKYLPQQWAAPTTTSGYVGGVVAKAGMRVCRATHPNGSIHPGKEWQGRCNYGYGGKEIVAASYQVLQLGFDKTAWSKSGGTDVVNRTTVTLSPAKQDQSTVVVTGLPSAPVTTPKIDMSTSTTQVSAVRKLGPLTHIQVTFPDITIFWTLSPVQGAQLASGAKLGVWQHSLKPSVATADVYDKHAGITFEKFGGNKPGFFGLRLLNTNLCITVTTGYRMGGNVELRTCDGGTSQMWGTISVGGVVPPTPNRLMSAVYDKAWNIQADAQASDLMNMLWGFDKSTFMCLKVVRPGNTITTGSCENDSTRVQVTDFPQVSVAVK